jgi:uncharacterized protein (DUF433 family)
MLMQSGFCYRECEMSDEVKDWEPRISIDPNVAGGRPVVRGTRLAVDYLLAFLAAGKSSADLREAWPYLTDEDIRACLAYARDAVRAVSVSTYDVPA